MKYTIAKIVKEVPVEGRFGPQIRTAFTTNETGADILSCFSKFNLKVGQSIEGEVTKTEKDGKTYHNFTFAKKNAVDNDLLQKTYKEVYAIRMEMVMIRQLLQQGGVIPKPESRVPDSTIPYTENEFEGADPFAQ